MPRAPLHSDDIKIEQKPVITDNPADRTPEVVVADQDALKNKEHLERLALGETPVQILIHPSQDQNAAAHIPVWVNGTGAEVMIDGKWRPTNGYLPVGIPLTIKHKALEVLVRAKVDKVKTAHEGAEKENPQNYVQRFTNPLCSFDLLDASPRSRAVIEELRRRNF